MKSSIGIDIDGCLNSFHADIIQYIKDIYNVDIPKNEYYITKLLNFSPQEEIDFWKKIDFETSKLEAEKDSKLIINKLKQIFEINIITARLYQSGQCTENWLKDQKISYDNLYFNTGNKLDVCKWKNIKLMIEDSPSNALILAQNGIKVLLYDRLYNQDVGHKNIIRCKNWNEIWSVISLLIINEK